MQLHELLSDFSRYNYWANKILSSMIRQAGSSKAEQEIMSSFPSMYKTVLHIFDAQFLWLHRMQHDHFPEAPSKSFKGSVDELVNEFLQSSKNLSDFVGGMQKDDFENTLTYKNSKGVQFESTFGETILHCLNHSTFHRGQVITMLRQAGETNLVPTDYVAYCRQK